MPELDSVPLTPVRTRRPSTDWKRRCRTLEQHLAQLLTSAKRAARAAGVAVGDDLTLTDIERQIIRAYRALGEQDRQAVRTVLSRFSRVDVVRKEQRDRLALERRAALAGAAGAGGRR